MSRRKPSMVKIFADNIIGMIVMAVAAGVFIIGALLNWQWLVWAAVLIFLFDLIWLAVRTGITF